MRETRETPPEPGAPGSHRAGIVRILLFVLTPPAAGSFIASLLLSEPGREPWVITGAFLLGLGFLLLAEPLGRRSDGLRIPRYRRLTEGTVLLGLTCGAVLVYAVVIHTLLGVRTPWASNLLRGLLGG